MRAAKVSTYPHRLLSVLAATCLLLLFPIMAGAQSYDFSGPWSFNSIISGPGAPWWERGTVTAAQDGTFTGSGTQSTGAAVSPSGSFTVSSSGIVMSLNGQFSTSLCMTDASNSTMSCTATLSDGSSNLTILTRKPSSISLANLTGAWEGSVLSSGPTSSWEQVNQTIHSDGTFTGSYTKSDGTTGALSGTLSISPDGKVTCVSGGCLDPTYASFVNSTATVMVGTSGAATSREDANLSVFTRQPGTFSIANLVGIWEESSIASGPGAPWWQTGLLFINADGTCLLYYATSDGTSNSQSGTVSISSSGVITVDLGTTEVGYVDPNMDVMVLTSTWLDGATHQISIFTNGTSPSPGTSSTVTYSTGNSSSTSSGSPYANSSSTSASSDFGTPGSNATSTHGAGGAGSLKEVSKPAQTGGTMQTGSSGATTPPSGPANEARGSAPTAATSAPEENHTSAPATEPGPPKIVVVTPGNSGALVNFKLPSNNGGQPITRCTVTANPGGLETTRVGSPIRVSNLRNGTSYTFKVAAANETGTGPPSQTSRSVTPGRVPDAPEILAVKTGSGQAEIRFKAPAANGGGKITSYTVTSSSGQKASGPRSPITVKGLAGGRPYTFTVTAANRTGSSRPSRASRSVTPR